MATTSIRKLLESFCTNSPWSYAVFWKLQQQNPMLLAYEDGYYDYQRLQLSSQSIFGDGYSRQDVTDFLYNAIADMSWRQYELGVGSVGRVAATGNDLWVYSDDIGSIEFMSRLEYPDEWLLPISGGINTTLLAPVAPHGILQLGSLGKVDEDWAALAYMKDRLIAHQCTESIALSENAIQLSSTLSQQWHKDESSFSNSSLYRRMNSDDSDEIHAIVETAEDEPSSGDGPVVLPFTIANCLHPVNTAAVPVLTDDGHMSYINLDLDVDSIAHNQFATSAIPDTIEDFWTSTFQEEDYYDDAVLRDSTNQISNYLVFEETQLLATAATDCETDHANGGSPESLPRDSELTGALGHNQTPDEAHVFVHGGFGLFTMEAFDFFDTGGDQEHEHLLEAVLTSVGNSSRSSLTSLEETAPSFQVPTSYEEPTAALTSDDTTFVKSQPPFSFVRLSSKVIGDEEKIKCTPGNSNKRTKSSQLGEGKEKPKSRPRARPRDRQLIQDRLNELRELVPDCKKCSIDGLLDETLKHMMFLKNMTEHAEKVKKITDQEPTVEDKRKDTRSQLCGTNLAQQVEDNLGSCPIIVKDLENPGQILIQMLCNDEEVFFDMTEVMNQLNLTILKGVMETHRNTWAQFIVQASLGFNRLDIFWPLMRILQRNGNWTMDQWCQ